MIPVADWRGLSHGEVTGDSNHQVVGEPKVSAEVLFHCQGSTDD